MRKICIVLLLALCFPLFAQQYSKSAIYIPYVEGSGSGVEDNSYFARLLEVEAVSRNYKIARDPQEAYYSLVGRINPHSNGNFVFQLDLVNNVTGSLIVQQEIIYRLFNEVHSLFPVLMLTMFSNIPEQPREEQKPVGTGRQQDYWLVLGAYGFWAPRIYNNNDDTSINFLNLGAGLSAEGRILDFLSLEAGLEFTGDWILIVGHSKDEFRDFVMEIPFFIKYIHYPSDTSFIGPFAGVKTTISLRGVTSPYALSWLAGLQYGTRVGPGFVFVEGRYSADFGDSSVNTGSVDQGYMRYMFNIGVGYKYGFFPKGQK